MIPKDIDFYSIKDYSDFMDWAEKISIKNPLWKVEDKSRKKVRGLYGYIGKNKAFIQPSLWPEVDVKKYPGYDTSYNSLLGDIISPENTKIVLEDASKLPVFGIGLYEVPKNDRFSYKDLFSIRIRLFEKGDFLKLNECCSL